MAIDSAQKRFSLLGLGSPVPRLLPIPQGTLAADDRALLIFLYSGIALGEEVAPPAAAETFTGGWTRKQAPFHGETGTGRKARIKAERVRLGIIEPDPENPAALERAHSEISRVPATGVSPEMPGFRGGALDPSLALDLAALHTSAWLDQEIARQFRILEDEDAAAVLLLAIATLH